jgi:ribosomal protein L13E
MEKGQAGLEAIETKSARHPPSPKQPITDPVKHSPAGRFVLLKQGRGFATVKDSGQPIHGLD